MSNTTQRQERVIDWQETRKKDEQSLYLLPTEKDISSEPAFVNTVTGHSSSSARSAGSPVNSGSTKLSGSTEGASPWSSILPHEQFEFLNGLTCGLHNCYKAENDVSNFLWNKYLIVYRILVMRKLLRSTEARVALKAEATTFFPVHSYFHWRSHCPNNEPQPGQKEEATQSHSVGTFRILLVFVSHWDHELHRLNWAMALVSS